MQADVEQTESAADLATMPVLLFDGVCNLCNGAVNFLIDRDPEARLRFASLQSASGQQLLRRFELPTDQFDTMVLVEGDRYYTRSTAGLRVARRLKWPWPLLSVFMVVPRPLRDLVYDCIARNRYRWFGQQENCRVPTPELRSRFLP